MLNMSVERRNHAQLPNVVAATVPNNHTVNCCDSHKFGIETRNIMLKCVNTNANWIDVPQWQTHKYIVNSNIGVGAHVQLIMVIINK